MEPLIPPDHIRCPDCGSLMTQVNGAKIMRDMLCLVCHKFITAYRGPDPETTEWLIFEPIHWWTP